MQLLLIEKNVADAQSVIALLARKSGRSVTVEHVRTIEAASDRLAAHSYDLILLEPPSLGPAALGDLQLVRSMAHATPIVIMSETQDPALALQAVHSGAQDYLVKSHLEEEQLWRTLHYAVERSRLDRDRIATMERLDEARLTAQNAEVYFRVVFESARDGIVVIDESGYYRDANPATVEMLGYSWEEICSRRVGDFSAEDPELSLRDFVSMMQRGVDRIRRERALRRQDGQIIIVEQHATRVSLPMGPCIVSVWRDVTAQRHANEVLRQWAEYFEHSEQGLFVAPANVDSPGICNPAYAKMHGVTVAQVSAAPRLSFVAEEERPRIRDLLGRLDAIGHLIFETLHVRNDGTRFPVLIDATCVRDEAGEVKYRMIHLSDITDRKRVESERTRLLAQTRAAESRYHGIFEAAADGILVLDAQLRITEANPSAIAMLGYPESESLLGRSMLELMEDGALDVDLRNPWRGEQGWVRLDGSTIPVEVATRRVELPDRSVTLVTAHDLTDRRALEQLRQEFLAIVAHELRNPLAAISGWAQLLRRGMDPGKAASVITDQTAELDRIISDLLDASQIDAGKLELRPEPTDLRELIQKVQEQEQASTHRLILHFQSQAPTLPIVVDPQRISQILRNLISNAIKYSPEGGGVWIQLEADDDWAVVTVRDEGVGIAAEDSEAIFDRFARLEGGRGVARGSGLGLPISRALADAHGGQLTASSPGEGLGSTFTLRLPRRD